MTGGRLGSNAAWYLPDEFGNGDSETSISTSPPTGRITCALRRTQLKGKRKSMKEAEGQARRAAAMMEEHGGRDGAGGSTVDKDPSTMPPVVSGLDRVGMGL